MWIDRKIAMSMSVENFFSLTNKNTASTGLHEEHDAEAGYVEV